MIKNFNLYTNEEINLLTRDIDEMLVKAGEGRFNAEINPRQVCKELYEELEILKNHFNNGYGDFAKKSDVPSNYYDAHFI